MTVSIRLTNFSDDSTKDNLFLARSLDRGSKLRIIPGVDFSLTANKRGIWMQGDDLLWEFAVWTWQREYWNMQSNLVVLLRGLPESADVVRIVGRPKRFPRAAWARMLFLNSAVP